MDDPLIKLEMLLYSVGSHIKKASSYEEYKTKIQNLFNLYPCINSNDKLKELLDLIEED